MKMLPNKPSELILVALADLEAVEQDGRYHVEMMFWHEPSYSTGLCEVCLAGAVMARSLGTDSSTFAIPRSFDTKTSTKLEVLNDFCQGIIKASIENLGFQHPLCIPARRKMTRYWQSKSEFKRDMRNLASDLAREGL